MENHTAERHRIILCTLPWLGPLLSALRYVVYFRFYGDGTYLQNQNGPYNGPYGASYGHAHAYNSTTVPPRPTVLGQHRT